MLPSKNPQFHGKYIQVKRKLKHNVVNVMMWMMSGMMRIEGTFFLMFK